MENSQFLGTEKIGKLILKLAVPAIVAQVVNLLYNIVDRMYIGHIAEIGDVALTGVGVCVPIILIITAFAMLVGSGGAPKASIALGQKNKEKAEKILGNCFVFSIILSVLLTVVLCIFKEEILWLFGASENTISYALDYLTIYIFGTIFVQTALGMNTFVTCQGFAKISMLTVCIGALLNLVLDPILIFAFNMGVRGAAIATVVSQAVSAIWVVCFLASKKTNIKLKLKNFKVNFKILLPCLLLGLSPFIMVSTEAAIQICFNTSLLKYGGDTAVGAMTILISLMSLGTMPLTGLTQGVQPIISYNYGARNTARVKKAFFLTAIIALTYTLSFFILLMAVPSVFVSAFTSDAVLKEYTVWALRIYMAGYGILGLQVSCQQTFVAIGNAKTSLFLAILRKIILLIPLIYILPTFIANQSLAVILAEPIADVIAVLTTVTVFFFGFKKAIKKIEDEKEKKEQD